MWVLLFFFSLFRFESEVVRISQALFGFLAIRIYYLITGTPVIWLSIFKFGQLVFLKIFFFLIWQLVTVDYDVCRNCCWKFTFCYGIGLLIGLLPGKLDESE
jgi:hypothetical protein